MPFFVIALSEKSSDFSAWLMLGLPGLAYSDPAAGIWAGAGCLAGTIFNWLFLAGKVMKKSSERGTITFPSFLSEIAGNGGAPVRVLSSIILSFFFTVYISAQIIGMGKILNALLGVPEREGMIIGVLIVLLYTSLGGFIAVSWTDFFQALLVIGALGFLFFTLLQHVPISAGWNIKGTSFAGAIGGFSIALGYPGQPHILIRYMALKRGEDVKRSALISICWTVLSLAFAIGIGWWARSIFPALADREMVSILTSKRFLPPIMWGLMASAVIAAGMSTIDSQLLIITTSLSHDLTGGSEKLVTSRIVSAFVSLISLILALRVKELIYHFVLYAWSGLATSFGPPLILALYWKRINKEGVMAGMITGCVTTVLWHSIPFLRELIYEIVPAFLLSFLACILFSLFKGMKERDLKVA